MKVLTEKATFQFPDMAAISFDRPKSGWVMVTSAGKEWWFKLDDIIAIIPTCLPDECHATIWEDAGRIERGPKASGTQCVDRAAVSSEVCGND